MEVHFHFEIQITNKFSISLKNDEKFRDELYINELKARFLLAPPFLNVSRNQNTYLIQCESQNLTSSSTALKHFLNQKPFLYAFSSKILNCFLRPKDETKRSVHSQEQNLKTTVLSIIININLLKLSVRVLAHESNNSKNEMIVI